MHVESRRSGGCGARPADPAPCASDRTSRLIDAPSGVCDDARGRRLYDPLGDPLVARGSPQHMWGEAHWGELVNLARRSRTVRVVLFAVLSALVVFTVLPSSQTFPEKGTAGVRVTRVIDGDTVEICCLEGRPEKVRYIGVNTPETNHPSKGVEEYGHEAKEANRRLVAGKAVRLELDVDPRDRYGRLLAYVYLEDGTFVNAWLVEQGFAQVMTVPPNVKYQELLLKLQRGARDRGKGLWGQRN